MDSMKKVETILGPSWKDLTRQDLEEGYVTRLNKRFFGKPDIRLVEIDGRRAVHKDIKEKPFLLRYTLGLWLIHREFRIYQRLSGCPGVPRLHSRPDRWSILVEYMEGEPLRRGDPRLHDPRFFERLSLLIEAIHARGIVHLDLRHKGNILITDKEEPSVIDFNSSFCLDRSALGQWVLPWLKRIDAYGLLKLKQRVAPDLLTQAERATLRWFRIIRRLWIFS
jgi:hypothetical protein